MKVALFSPDSKIPNLAIMKLSSYFKSKGRKVDFLKNMPNPDVIYVSVIFIKNKDRYYGLKHFYPKAEIIYGGSGINYNVLPDRIEYCMPDYDLYNIDYSMGFITRGCIRNCSFCIVRKKEGKLRFNSNLESFVDPRFNKLVLLDNNLLAYSEHKQILKQIKDTGFKVDFNQGLDIRLINEDNAKLLSEIKYYNIHFNKRSLKFAFDNSKIKSSLNKGFNILTNNGIKPKDMMFYILSNPNNFQDALDRTKYIMSLGSVPYIMKEDQMSSPDLNKLARWVNRLYYQFIDWKDFIN